MSNQIKSQIQALIANEYAETKVYHTHGENWNGQWRKGACAQIAAPYGGTRRIYADTYADLLEALQDDIDVS